MRQEYEPQDLMKEQEEEQSRPSDWRPGGSVSQARHIALGPLLYLMRVFFPVWVVVLSWVRPWWHHPIVGYLIALLSQAIAVSIVLLLIHIFPNFAILGLLLILATLIVSLDWGAGPSLFTALVSTALFNYFLLSPQFTWSFQNPQQVAETSIFLLIGITISLLAGRAKHARLESEAARSRLETLVAQLHAEQEALHQAKQEADAQAHQLEAVFEAVTDTLVVLDVNEQVMFANAAFRALVADDATSGYFSQSLQDRGKWFAPQDEQGNSLPNEHWPITRVLKGEILTGANTVDVSVNTPAGQTLYLNMGGAPIHNGNGQISGAVMLARDVTQRRQLERQMQEALSALRKSEARFRRLFDANILGIHFANVNGTVTESNDTFLQMVGFTHEELQEGRLRWDEITSA
ncbi:MAG TPA: DUF4118 domain-containing protein, partial [Ktedonobacteraceae bacterium]|nr:DUF4118 domain-containing protein [Ktedonobacteraceae bacterium]